MSVNKNKFRSVLVNIPIELDNRYLELSKKLGVSKTATILIAMNWYLDYRDTMNVLPDTIEAIKKLENPKKSKS